MHIDALAAAFRDLGHQTETLDYESGSANADFERILKDPIDLIFSINALGTVLMADEKPLSDALGIPYVTLMVDHPALHIDRLAQPIEKFVVTCLDRSHVEFLREFFGADSMPLRALMLPGAHGDGAAVDDDAAAFGENRTIPLLFSGTYRGDVQREWADWPNTLAKAIIDDAVDLALANDRMPVEEALRRVAVERGMEFAPRSWRGLLEACGPMTNFIHARRRQDCLETLNAAGIPLHIYGSGWEEQMARFKAFTFGGVGSFEETLELLKKTRLCLNTNTNFVAGGHERVFSAMLGGAAVISDESSYYLEAFNPGEDILLYRWTELDRLPELVNRYLEAPDALFPIASSGQTKVRAQHLWAARAEQILGLGELCQRLTA